MRRAFILIGILVLVNFAISAEPHHQLTRVFLHNDAEVLRFLKMGLDVVNVAKGEFAEAVTTEGDLQNLQQAGLEFKVQIADMEEYYHSQNKNSDPMGGFYTYSEMLERMNLIHQTYPNLTTAPFSIGQSWENRDLWVMKVSDNPEIDEDETEIWYDGLHHAREPITMQLLIYFIEYLCTNYGINTQVTEAVNNREMFFCPCTNPDGYCYNQLTNPNGGGMWRKNRRDNGGGVYGVDLNRNYPYDWGHDDIGSSPNPGSETYRGPYPASEPEVQAIIAFINTRHFALSHSYHSYGDLCLYPWGSQYNGYTPEQATFVAISTQIVSYNGYDPGTPWELLYDVNGGSIDWHYGQQNEHYRIMAFSQEVGTTGFWPPATQIPTLCEENVMPNLYSALIAEQYAPPDIYLVYVRSVVDDTTGGNANGSADPGENIGLTVSIRNTGTSTASGLSSVLTEADPYVTITTGASLYPDLPSLSCGENLTEFQLEIAQNCPTGHSVVMDLVVNGTGFTDTVRFDLLVGDPLFLPSGPDNYGYLAYDYLDGHQYGAYSWIEIDPTYGGSGTPLNFTLDDQTFQVNIPFTFTYYGQNYTQVSICTNGWIAMGFTTSTDHSNSGIPNLDGPPAMIAPFWEDLSPQILGEVCTYYDSISNVWIVEYSRVRQYSPASAIETFEAILYDPTVYPTLTGDGLIKFQYHTVSDPSSITVGIENQTETDGLQLLYNGTYDPNFHPLLDGAAVIFTTGEEAPPSVIITLTPIGTPIVIPPGGGSFSYTAQVSNIGPNPAIFDIWTEVTLPNSQVYGPILLREGLTLAGGATIQRTLTQFIPGNAPAGNYTYTGKVGSYPNLVFSESSFPFSKSGVDASGNGGWDISGWDGGAVNSSLTIPTNFSLSQNYPNPFNAQTAIEFALPEASKVKISVFNISGQQAETILDGEMEAGYYSVNWNAGNLTSGVYFYRLETEKFTSFKKCVLLK